MEAFSPVILNPPDGVGNIEIYHASSKDFMTDSLRSKEHCVNDAHAHEHLGCRCLDLLARTEPGYGAAAHSAHQCVRFWWGIFLWSILATNFGICSPVLKRRI
jgi:hypothetical protein